MPKYPNVTTYPTTKRIQTQNVSKHKTYPTTKRIHLVSEWCHFICQRFITNTTRGTSVQHLSTPHDDITHNSHILVYTQPSANLTLQFQIIGLRLQKPRRHIFLLQLFSLKAESDFYKFIFNFICIILWMSDWWSGIQKIGVGCWMNRFGGMQSWKGGEDISDVGKMGGWLGQ